MKQVEYEVAPQFFAQKNQSGVKYTKSTGIKTLPGREKTVRLIWNGKETEAHALLAEAFSGPVEPSSGKYSNYPLLAQMKDAGLLKIEALGPKGGQRFVATEWGREILVNIEQNKEPS